MAALQQLEQLERADPARWRIVVSRDDSADGPLEWGRLTVIRVGSDATPTGGSDPLHLAAALERLENGDGMHGGVRTSRGAVDVAADAAIRWARIFHGVAVQRWRPVAYAQSDWADGLAYLQETDDRAQSLELQTDQLSGELDTLASWWRGDVWHLQLQQRVTWHAHELADIPEGTPRTRETWEWVDGIGGTYFDNGPEGEGYNARAAAAENLNTPDGLDVEALEVVTTW